MYIFVQILLCKLKILTLIDPNLIINQTRKWVTDVVVGCNFCPFAAREVKRESIRYVVSDTDDAA